MKISTIILSSIILHVTSNMTYADDRVSKMVSSLGDASMLARVCGKVHFDNNLLGNLIKDYGLKPDDILDGGKYTLTFRRINQITLENIIQTAKLSGREEVDIACELAREKYGQNGSSRAGLLLERSPE